MGWYRFAPAVTLLHYLLAHGRTDTLARVLRSMKALKRKKDFVRVFPVDTETVIRHTNAPLASVFF